VWFADRLREFEAEDQRELFAPGGIVFIGSSSIHFWEGLRGDFPAYRVLNRGIAGAQTSDLLMVLPRLVHRYSPRQVVIYVGTNDLSAGKSNDQVLRDLSTLFDQIRVSFPQTRISWIELAPNPARWWLLETFRDLNSKVAAGVSERSSFEIIPVFHAMLGEDGRPLQGIFREDQLHLNARGYALWKALIGPYLLPEPNAIPVLEGATSNP
jgi:lysophospholipase L1-like esterase